MEDEKKTKAQLIVELQKLRGKIADETSGRKGRKSKESSDEVRITEIWETCANSLIPSLILSKQGKIVHYNNAMEKLTGYAHREVSNIEAWMSKLYPDEKYRNHVIEVSRKSRYREIDVISEEFTRTKKNGEKRTIEFYVVDIFKDGKPIDLQIVQGIDITERKQAEKKLHQSEEQLRVVFETAKDSIFIKDITGRYVKVNPVMEKVLGMQSSSINGSSDEELATKQNLDQISEEDARVLNGETIKVEHTFIINGVPLIFDTIKVPLRDRKGAIIGLCGIARDITENKQINESLKASESELKKQKFALEQKSIALREVIGEIETEKNKIKDDITININEVLLPMIEKIKLQCPSNKYVLLLQLRLEKLISSYGRNITNKKYNLTLREIEICTMVERGLMNNEISKILNISYLTVLEHRKKIRKKLNITNKKINLTSFLRNLDF